MKSKYTGTYFGMTRDEFDSDEELEFYCWLKEAELNGLISGILFHPHTFDLSSKATIKLDKIMKTKIKTVDKFILRPHVYTPDFEFCIESSLIYKLNILVENKTINRKFMLVDVKGTYSRYGDAKQFSINQKWVWDKYGIYVQKIVPEKLFLKSWVPEVCRLSPVQRKPVKKYIDCKTIGEFTAW